MSAFGVRFEVLALASPPPLSSAVLGKTKLRKRASGGLQQQNFGLVLFVFGFFFLSPLYIPAFHLLFCSGGEQQCFVQRSCAGAEVLASSSHSQQWPQIQPFMFDLCKSGPAAAKLGFGHV